MPSRAESPHPKQGPGASHGDGRRHAHNVPRADGAGQGSAQRLEGGELPSLPGRRAQGGFQPAAQAPQLVKARGQGEKRPRRQDGRLGRASPTAGWRGPQPSARRPPGPGPGPSRRGRRCGRARPRPGDCPGTAGAGPPRARGQASSSGSRGRPSSVQELRLRDRPVPSWKPPWPAAARRPWGSPGLAQQQRGPSAGPPAAGAPPGRTRPAKVTPSGPCGQPPGQGDAPRHGSDGPPRAPATWPIQ